MEKRIPNNWFPVLVWILTVVITGPFFSILLIRFLGIEGNTPEERDLIYTLRIFICAGLIFSFPVFLIYCAIFRFYTKSNKSTIYIKFCLNAICTIGVFITFYIMSASVQNIYFSILYSICAIISSSIFKVYSSKGSQTKIARR